MGLFYLLNDKKIALLLIYEEKCLDISRMRCIFVISNNTRSTLQFGELLRKKPRATSLFVRFIETT